MDKLHIRFRKLRDKLSDSLLDSEGIHITNAVATLINVSVIYSLFRKVSTDNYI